ncbi:MAG: DUF4276 family protein [Chloroflexi bacterium]|nr:DUF4276 family protein [Chloroflexota bacterium]
MAKRIRPDLEIISETLDNKPNLIAECGIVAAQLLEDSCARVLVVWDLYPAWRERGAKPCRKEDRDGIMASLTSAGVGSDKVALVCIEEELEAWLLADNRAISKVLSRPTHKVNIKRQRNPERGNPKKRMTKLFNENVGRPYHDLKHAEMIARAIPDLQRLRRVDAFRRFALKVADVEL